MTRIGRVTGTRLPIRRTSTWGIARSAPRNQSRRSSAKQERIASGDDHLPQGGRPGHVIHHRLQSLPRSAGLVAAPHPLAVAMPAVDGAVARDDRQTPVGIAVDQPRNRHGALLAEGIIDSPPGEVELPGIGKALPAEGIFRIGRVQERPIIGGDREGIDPDHRPPGCEGLSGQIHRRGELFQRLHPVPELPLPVAPVRRHPFSGPPPIFLPPVIDSTFCLPSAPLPQRGRLLS